MRSSVRPIGRSLLAAVGVAASLLALTAAPASAGGEVTTWSPSGCGSVQTTTVPANVHLMEVTIAGGKGGKGGGQSSGTTGSGGRSGLVIASFAVTPGQTISAIAGCNGNNGPESGSTPAVAGWAPGGSTGQGQNTAFDPSGAGGGGGGGASAVCIGSSCVAGSGTPLVVAGGGGGSGSSNCAGTTGGDGGTGGAGSTTSAGGGAGASGANGGSGANSGFQTGSIPGGAGGVNANGGSSSGGSSPNGSGGLQVNVVGGGGGGGFVGGGAGANASTGCKAGGAGGGGSSWASASAIGAFFDTADASSVVVRFTTDASVPGAPSIVGALATNAQAIVAWTAPTDTGGAPINGYVVTAYVNGIAQATQSFAGDATSGWVTGLDNGTTYTFTVAALNSAGAGPESAPSSAVTPVGPPSQVRSPNARPGDGAAVVSWAAPLDDGGGGIVGHLITPIKDGVAQAPITFASSDLTQTVTGLQNGSKYRFRIQAYNTGGFGQSIATATITIGAPLPPTTPGAVPGDASATVKWTPPASDNGSPITGYRVTPYLGSTPLTTRTFGASATQGTMTGLTNGTTYTFRIAAVNARGAGPTTSTSAIKIGTPTAPKVTAVAGAGSVAVSWTTPQSNSSPIVGYTMQIFQNGSLLFTQNLGPSTNAQNLPGLTPGVSYQFKVSATNGVGTGPQGSSAVVVPT